MLKEDAIKEIKNKLSINQEEASKILEKSIAGGEIIHENYDFWLQNRFFPFCVEIDEDGYAKMCVDALKILDTTTATDFGASRQRDMGQLWADMTRGYLGEYALKLFLEKQWGINCTLGHEKGHIDEYLKSDIRMIKLSNENTPRPPKIDIGVKSAKWNAIWLDLPGAQYQHSDIHVLVKVGAGRDHLFAFFKKISVFRDKILRKGQEIGSLSDSQATNLYDRLPTFKSIPAFICGFVEKNVDHEVLRYGGKKGRKNYTINQWDGKITSADIDIIKKREEVIGQVTFEGIGKFSHQDGYLFNTGSLFWDRADWEKKIIQRL